MCEIIKNRRAVQVTVFQKCLMLFVFLICGCSFIMVVLQVIELIPSNNRIFETIIYMTISGITGYLFGNNSRTNI